MKKLRLGGALVAVLALMATLSGCATGNAENGSTDSGSSSGSTASHLLMRLERLAHSELRAVERALEILERGL